MYFLYSADVSEEDVYRKLKCFKFKNEYSKIDSWS